MKRRAILALQGHAHRHVDGQNCNLQAYVLEHDGGVEMLSG